MSAVRYYQDLCKEIDILHARIEDLEREYNHLYRQLHNGRKKPTMRPHIALERMKEICDIVEYYSRELDEKEAARKHIEERISELDSIDYKVVYRRDILGMTLIEIAADLGYSYDWIKRISMRNKKVYTDYTPTA